MATGREGIPSDRGEIIGREGGLLGRLDEDGGARKEGGDDRGKGVVEGVAIGGCQFDVSLAESFGDEMRAYFQLTQAARTPNGSHRTSLCLYIIKKLVGRRSGLNAFSPCWIVHFNFSTVTRISPNIASTLVLPESRHATVAMSS